jgi:hypothetical protein
VLCCARMQGNAATHMLHTTCIVLVEPSHVAACAAVCRFMFLWLSAMPWAMWSEVHWMVVPITAAVSYLLLGIGEYIQHTCTCYVLGIGCCGAVCIWMLGDWVVVCITAAVSYLLLGIGE